MQYHWVVMYDHETGRFDIDWDMTYQALDGIIFDQDNNEWLMPYDLSDSSENYFDTLSIHLENAISKDTYIL